MARGDKPYLRKSTDRKAQISPRNWTNAFLICALRSVDFLGKVYHPEPPNAQSLFLFPIVFGIKAGPRPPLEAILVIFGRRALIFFLFESSWKKWKMTPLLCACAVVITLETQKCRKRAPRSVEFNFFTNCDWHKRFSQNERRRAVLQNVASDFLIFASGRSDDLSKFSDIFTPFFRLWKTITQSLGKN